MKESLIHGIGVNDADYITQVMETVGYIKGKQKQRRIWICPFYAVWKSMLMRCCSSSYKEKHPTYIECSPCKEWLLFSNFKSWMEQQDWEGKQLDKDILFPDNKIYSPETCVFISPIVNTFVVARQLSRGEWPIGVCWDKNAKKFVARCNNPFTKKGEHLGRFNCPQQAHKAWLTRKLELAKMLAEQQDDPRVAKALVDRYENYGTGERNNEEKLT